MAAALRGTAGSTAGTTPPPSRQIRATLDQCHAASSAIASGRQREAEDELAAIAGYVATAGWIGELAEQARQWGEVETAIRASPLSLLALGGRARGRPKRVNARGERRPGPQSLVLHVDGVGSFQVLPGPGFPLARAVRRELWICR